MCSFCTDFQKRKAKTTARTNSRHRPLHACGVSIFSIIEITIGKTQHINGPKLGGSTFKRLTKLAKCATPLIYAIQFKLLTFLSFIDDAILAIEKTIEKLFPPSTRMFDKIDEIVQMIMSLPEKFDAAVNKFPTMIHNVPFLDWALTLLISRLNSLVSTLNHWGEENSSVNEKTIGVDRSCSESSCEGYIPMDDINSENLEIFPPIISECEYKEVQDMALSSHVKASYKEALERGKEETTDDEQIENQVDECEGNNEECDDDHVGRSESVKDGDTLLQLFESAWLMKSGRH